MKVKKIYLFFCIRIDSIRFRRLRLIRSSSDRRSFLRSKNNANFIRLIFIFGKPRRARAVVGPIRREGRGVGGGGEG